jgi:hypothetical protein
MGTTVIKDADPPGAITEGNQLFTEDHQAHWIAIGLDFVGQRSRKPILAHKGSHWRSGTNMDKICDGIGIHRYAPRSSCARRPSYGYARRRFIELIVGACSILGLLEP